MGHQLGFFWVSENMWVSSRFHYIMSQLCPETNQQGKKQPTAPNLSSEIYTDEIELIQPLTELSHVKPLLVWIPPMLKDNFLGVKIYGWRHHNEIHTVSKASSLTSVWCFAYLESVCHTSFVGFSLIQSILLTFPKSHQNEHPSAPNTLLGSVFRYPKATTKPLEQKGLEHKGQILQSPLKAMVAIWRPFPFAVTLPETNSKRHLKKDGWNTFSFPFGDLAYFQGYPPWN